MLNYFKKLLTISAVLVSIHATAQEMNIQLAQKGHAVDQSLYGIFFEEINHAGDGGLYAELVLAGTSLFAHHICHLQFRGLHGQRV